MNPQSIPPLQHLVAVAPSKFSAGIDGIADGNITNLRGLHVDLDAYEVLELRTALLATYASDAHLVAYTLRGGDGTIAPQQPRINKPGLVDVRALGRVATNVFFADVDNLGHGTQAAKWSSPEQAIEMVREVSRRLPTVGIYVTSSGLRLVQPLTCEVDVEDGEARLETWLTQIEAALVGLRLLSDLAHLLECRDWTRHMRLPNVVRDGKPYPSPLVYLNPMVSIDPPAPAVRAVQARVDRAAKPPRTFRPPTERQSKTALRKRKANEKKLREYVGPSGEYKSGGNNLVRDLGRLMGGFAGSGCLGHQETFDALAGAIADWGDSAHNQLDTLERAIEFGMREPLMPDDPPPGLDNLLCSDNGKPLAGVANCALIFEARWGGALGWDERRCRAEWIDTPPWGGEGGRAWLEGADDVAAVRWLAENFKMNEKPHVAGSAAMAIARKAPFDRFRDYLENLPAWDGEERINAIAMEVLGASEPIAGPMLAKTMIGECARTFTPGSKVDTICILKGPQGAKKSTFWEALVPPGFYATASRDMFDRDGKMGFLHAALVDVEELDAMRGREVTKVKAFLSQHTDTFRAPYARGSSEHPRRFCFVGTTNSSDFLEDTTGNRRFWIIEISKTIELDVVRRHREQWWAEAVGRYRDGENWWFEGSDEEAASSVAEEHRGVDPWEELIEAALETGANDPHFGLIKPAPTPIPPNCSEVTVGQILDLVVRRLRQDRQKSDEQRVGKILRKLGFERSRSRAEGKQKRIFVKKPAAETDSTPL